MARFRDALLRLLGSSSGETILKAAATASGTLTFPAGTTDFSATGGSSQVVKQTGSGAAFTVGQLAQSDISGTLGADHGGTGVANNSASTLTVSGNFGTTFTVSATTNVTLPAGTHTLAGLDVAQTWSAAQSYNSGDLKLNGATSGAITLNAAAIAGANTITLPAGTTDFSATGGAGQVVKQLSLGGPFTTDTIAPADIAGQAWTSYTPTISAGAGTFTTVSATGKYYRIGNQVIAQVDILITTNGTAGTFIKATMPIARGPASDPMLGFGNRSDGRTLAVQAVSGTEVAIFLYDGTYPGVASDHHYITVIYEV